MRCVISLLKFRSETEREQKRVVLNCGREIKSNKWLAETEDSTIAFLVKLGACIQIGLMELVTAAGVWLFPGAPVICVRHPLLWAGIELFRREQMRDFFSLPCRGSNWPVQGKRWVLSRRRVGVCAYVDLRKGGLSTPLTEDVRWVEAARKSSKQLWWPAFLMPHVV